MRGILRCCIAALAATATFAAEVSVQNDDLTDGQFGSIVSGFVPGEEVAARLTSPCDGKIVAVQILWWQPPGAANPDSLEEAIRIYADGAHPVPGAVLELLAGPVLVPGFLNEFRFTDEGGTVPIDVPVFEGQRFYVALEFANANNVLNGDSSVLRDVSGCVAGRNAIFAVGGLFNGWAETCPLVNGDFVIRAIVDCDEPVGACCRPDGTCSENVREAACLNQPGSTWFEGQTCAQQTCPRVGACCRDTGCLSFVEEVTCEAIQGVFAGPGTECSICTRGACCLPTGECSLEFSFDCTALGGIFQGIGSTCSPNPCPQPGGACCFGDVCVPNQLRPDCETSGGVWAGPLTTCDDVNGDGHPDACAPRFGLGDMNCDGAVNAGDIDGFVLALVDQSAYAAAYPDCAALLGDCTMDGSLNAADIDCFVQIIVSGG